MEERYAVVRENVEFRFTKWHDTLEQAKAEAERLCRKERSVFVVLKMVACCSVEEIPVTWREFKPVPMFTEINGGTGMLRHPKRIEK